MTRKKSTTTARPPAKAAGAKPTQMKARADRPRPKAEAKAEAKPEAQASPAEELARLQKEYADNLKAIEAMKAAKLHTRSPGKYRILTRKDAELKAEIAALETTLHDGNQNGTATGPMSRARPPRGKKEKMKVAHVLKWTGTEVNQLVDEANAAKRHQPLAGHPVGGASPIPPGLHLCCDDGIYLCSNAASAFDKDGNPRKKVYAFGYGPDKKLPGAPWKEFMGADVPIFRSIRFHDFLEIRTDEGFEEFQLTVLPGEAPAPGTPSVRAKDDWRPPVEAPAAYVRPQVAFLSRPPHREVMVWVSGTTDPNSAAPKICKELIELGWKPMGGTKGKKVGDVVKGILTRKGTGPHGAWTHEEGSAFLQVLKGVLAKYGIRRPPKHFRLGQREDPLSFDYPEDLGSPL